MSTYYPFYICLWGSACLVALVLYLREREAYAISSRAYWRFLFRPWKVVTFVISATGLTVMAPYTGDPTWDYPDALVMSLLTFAAAPWVIGVLHKAFRGHLPKRQAYVAFCVWMFSVSWFYDTYILIRDGEYTPLWLPNIFASSALYVFAGLLWNLEWSEARGTYFAFTNDHWPSPQTGPTFHRIVWVGLLFMGAVALMILPFLFDGYLDIASWLDAW